jgi:hypothetical protein
LAGKLLELLVLVDKILPIGNRVEPAHTNHFATALVAIYIDD